MVNFWISNRDWELRSIWTQNLNHFHGPILSLLHCTYGKDKEILFWVCRQIGKGDRKKEWPLHFVHFLGEFELLISSGSEKNATRDGCRPTYVPTFKSRSRRTPILRGKSADESLLWPAFPLYIGQHLHTDIFAKGFIKLVEIRLNKWDKRAHAKSYKVDALNLFYKQHNEK